MLSNQIEFFIVFFLCLWKINLIYSQSSQSNKQIYSAISSKILTPSSLYNVTVFVEKNEDSQNEESLRFSVAINSYNESWPSEEIAVEPGRHGVISIPIDELKETKYNLTLKIQDGRGHEWENVSTIFTLKQDRSIFLQTDKPLYKPGETVKFRVVVLNRELKPFSSDQAIEIKILDPEKNIIKLWTGARVHNGLFKSKLDLSSEPVMGDWTLEVKTKRFKNDTQRDKGDDTNLDKKIVSPLTTPEPIEDDYGSNDYFDDDEFETDGSVFKDKVQRVKFSVEKYVLPKFKVNLKLPPFLTYNMTSVSVSIDAKYTYGKGVAGQVTITPKQAYYWGQVKVKVETFTAPLNDGTAIVDVNIKHLFTDLETYDREIVFDASVTESVTGKVENGSSTLKIYKLPYKIEPIVMTPELKLGLPFKIGFKVTTQNDIPISDSSPDAIKISHGFSYRKERGSFNSSIPSNGIVFFIFDSPTNELIRVERIEVTYKELMYSHYVPQNYYSQVKAYLRVQIQTDNPIGQPSVAVNSNVNVNVNATRKFNSINYIIQARKEILSSGKFQLDTPQEEFNFQLNCPERARPEATLIVYIVLTDTKEVVADSIKFTATFSKKDLDNYLDISLSDETREPGHNVTLKINSKAGSLVALRGVDQSVLLLNKKDNDINQETIDNEIKNLNNDGMNTFRIWGGDPNFQVFETAGLIIQTNARLQIEKRSPWFRPRRGKYRAKMASDNAEMAFDAAPMAFANGAAVARITGGQDQQEIRVRSHFPESWIWEETLLQNETFDMTRVVPDTLTSWVITGYSLNKEFGIGAIIRQQNLTVFRPFFITLNLPYQIIKGEILSLQVLVHNYIPSETNIVADITLDNTREQFQFADASLKSATFATKKVTCKPNSVTSVTFVIIAKQFGSIMLNVKGVTDWAGDAVAEVLRVRPPGEQQSRSVSSLLTVTDKGKTETNLSTIFPAIRVEGADHVKMTIVSDILGSSIENLDKLLQLPTGCGEQNMLNFVADIVILNYLEATQTLNSDIKSKAIGFLEKGYQRELTYRHADSSYSAFGNSDPVGSTWLTAFVARSFIGAKRFITIDDKVIEKALTFLTNQQDNASGHFQELGKVIHKGMQGGSNSNGIALTAYTILAFIEASQHWNKTLTLSNRKNNPQVKDYSKIIEKGLGYIIKKVSLQGNVDGKVNDVYAIVLATYALHLADHKDKEKYFHVMEKLARREGGLTYWDNEKNEELLNILRNKTIDYHRPWEILTRSVAVEITGYALLTHILRGNVAQTTSIVKWLLLQRNSNGGFISTQDTVLGLTALAQFGELTKDANTNLHISAVHPGGQQQVNVTNANSIVLQEFILPPTTPWVNLEVTGKGTALAQLSWTYYIEDKVEKPAFSLDVKVRGKRNNIVLKVCTSYLFGQSNMVMVEINFPSGYSVDSDSLSELKNVPQYKRHDIQNMDSKVEIYLESLTAKKVCLDVAGSRIFKVEKKAKTFVSVYDYYDPSKKARTFYQPPNSVNEI